MSNNKGLKRLTMAVGIALLASLALFLLTFLLKEPAKVSAELPMPPNSVSVGR